ncbi:MAG: GAF domain-containing protein [Desulfobacteraceae bacterium]
MHMESPDFKVKLKEKALKKLNHTKQDMESMERADIHQLVEELQIHQIELEIQNDELRNIQSELATTTARYISLFDNAPMGYVILDRSGIIKQFNTTFEAMFGLKRDRVSGAAFADLLEAEDARLFRARFPAIFRHPENKHFEFSMPSQDYGLRHVRIETKSHQTSAQHQESEIDELLLMIMDITELTQTQKELESALEATRDREKEVRSLLDGARAVLTLSDFKTTARQLFDICSQVIRSTSGYVALMSDSGEENEVLFLESGNLPCSVDPDLPMPIRGLREKAYRTSNTVYENEFMNSEWAGYMPAGHVRLENVMFAPLVIENQTVGVIGLANKPEDFTETDARVALGFGKLCAIALQNSRNLEKREASEKKNQGLIKELKEALANVRQLSGLLPICGHCKRIRDDKGYWNQLEQYIHDHTDATFSHGICQECARKYYPDMDLYED